MSADANGYLTVQPRLAAFIQPARDKDLITPKQYDIRDYLLEIRTLLCLRSGQKLVFIHYNVEQFFSIVADKSVPTVYVLLYLFSFYN